MIIRDVLDDDIEVAIKVKFFYCDKFSTEGYKGKKKVWFSKNIYLSAIRFQL